MRIPRCKSQTVAVAMMTFALLAPPAFAAGRRSHTVFLGAVKKVPYSKAGDPAGAQPNEAELKIRALVVDGQVREWTAGDTHDITDRSFVVRRVLKINDTLPGDTAGKWVWQRGPWLLVNRATGRINALKLPDYDPGVSQVSWFRDYAAYCGVTPSGKSLYAVVAQIAVRKPVLSKKLAPFQTETDPISVCAPVQWQRDPLKVVFHPAGKDAVTFDVVPGSAALVEGTVDETGQTAASKTN